MQIIAKNDGTEHDVTDAVLGLSRQATYADYLSLDREEEDAVLALAAVTGHDTLTNLAERIRYDREEAEAVQRRRDEYARTEAERQAQRAKAAAQLAAEMREQEPGLVRAGWTDAELVELHRMRNAGRA